VRKYLARGLEVPVVAPAAASFKIAMLYFR
jgi:hypothetical protein